MNLFTKEKQTDSKSKLMVTKGEMWWGGISQAFGLTYTYTIIYTVDDQQGPSV